MTTYNWPHLTKTKKVPQNEKKLRIGWFSFSGCEGETILMTELMNDYWQEWKRMFDFRHARVLQSKNVLDKMDIAFIEGAIASDEQIAKVKEIRNKAEKIVAVGACAVTGLPSGQRNNFDEIKKQEIAALVARFKALPRVLKVSDVVKVDASVPGCPMDPKVFMETLNKVTAELRS